MAEVIKSKSEEKSLKRHRIEQKRGSQTNDHKYSRGSRVPPIKQRFQTLPLSRHVTQQHLGPTSKCSQSVVSHPNLVSRSCGRESIELLIQFVGAYEVHVR
uniref:Uncharacterized protein n=1 Tax=Cucumis sativus TaxID=3659 RepID=A0A0A0KYZ0_CUCSA